MRGLIVAILVALAVAQSYDTPSTGYSSVSQRRAASTSSYRAPAQEEEDDEPGWWERQGARLDGAINSAQRRLNNGWNDLTDAVSDSWEASVDFLDSKWNKIKNRWSKLRCRVRGGVREFYDESTHKWKRMTEEVDGFVSASKVHLKEGMEWTFDRSKNAWKQSVATVRRNWDALKARFAGMKCRVKSGVREFYDESTQKWKRFTTEMDEFIDETHANLREGVEMTFDKATNSWKVVRATVRRNWDSLKARFAGMKCRVKSGVREFYDASTNKWKRFTAEMEEFVEETHADLREGVEMTFDKATNKWKAIRSNVREGINDAADFLDAKWDAIKARYARVRCRVRGGVREFYDKSKNAWKRMDQQMEEFVDASKANLREGVEFTFDLASNSWEVVSNSAREAVDFLDAKWDAFKARFARMRCRVKNGVREFYDKSQNKWKRMTLEMEEFVDASKANFREGVEWTFDKASNTWKAIETAAEDVANFLDSKWDALKSRFSQMRCRVKNGVREFFDEKKGQWKEMTVDMKEFVDASKANLREGVEWTFDVTSNGWKIVQQNVRDSVDFLDRKWDAFKARFRRLRCRVRADVREYYDEKKGEWKRMTAEMEEFVVASHLKLKEGVQWTFDAATDSWKETVDLVSARWVAFKAKYRKLRCRVRNGATEFFDKAQGKWVVATGNVAEFLRESKVKLEEGIEVTFDAASDSWDQSIDFLSSRWSALKARFSRLRCRVKGGVREFFDETSQRWTRMTADVDEFVIASRIHLKEGVEWTFDKAANAWRESVVFIHSKWNSFKTRFSNTRCRVKSGVREFWDNTKQEWKRMDAQMEEFLDVTRANLREGAEWTFDIATNTWKAVTSSVGNAVAIMDRKWDAFKARFAHMRCRVKSGVREFYDKSEKKWKRMTLEMEEFVDASKANFREGVEWTFDVASNTWKAIERASETTADFLDAKWDALRARFTNMRCRVKNGAREFWDESTNKWKRMNAKMEEFVDVTKANLREGAVWTFDASTNAWRAVVEAVGDAGEFLDARWDAFKARMKNVRCRVRDGVREYYDEKKGEWKAMTLEMKEFVHATRANLLDGVEWTFDTVSNSWKVFSDAIDSGMQNIEDSIDARRARIEAARSAAAAESAAESVSSGRSSYQAPAPSSYQAPAPSSYEPLVVPAESYGVEQQ